MLDLPPVKAKGLIKGLRYISQMFDGDQKEREMVIGNPTDVKHVAHIGHDGPSPANPSWMNDFHSAPLSSSFGRHGKELGSPKSASQEIPLGGGDMASPKPRRARRHVSEEATTTDSSTRDRSRGSRRSHRHKSSDPESLNPGGSETRRSRRHKKKQADADTGSQVESESSVTDLPNVPKQSRRKERKSRLCDGVPVSSSSEQKSPSLAAPVPA